MCRKNCVGYISELIHPVQAVLTFQNIETKENSYPLQESCRVLSPPIRIPIPSPNLNASLASNISSPVSSYPILSTNLLSLSTVDKLLRSFPHPPSPTPYSPSFKPLNRHAHEKLTNLGSLGLPSAPIPFLANRPSIYISRASSKFTRLFRMIFWISFLAPSSNPARESPERRLGVRLKLEEVRPDSMSLAKEEEEGGRRV